MEGARSKWRKSCCRRHRQIRRWIRYHGIDKHLARPRRWNPWNHHASWRVSSIPKPTKRFSIDDALSGTQAITATAAGVTTGGGTRRNDHSSYRCVWFGLRPHPHAIVKRTMIGGPCFPFSPEVLLPSKSCGGATTTSKYSASTTNTSQASVTRQFAPMPENARAPSPWALDRSEWQQSRSCDPCCRRFMPRPGLQYRRHSSHFINEQTCLTSVPEYPPRTPNHPLPVPTTTRKSTRHRGRTAIPRRLLPPASCGNDVKQ
jgi:hypothetical protein